MDTDIRAIERRTVRHWFEDGIQETTFGAVLWLLGLYFLARHLAPEKSAWSFALDVGLLPLFILGGWAMNRAIRSLKRKITYPRAGYVSYRKPDRRKRAGRAFVIGAAAGTLGALAALLLSAKPAGFAWLPAGTGLALALVLVILGVRTGMARLAPPALIIAAGGCAIAFLGWEEMAGLAGLYGISGTALVLSGGLACRRFIRKHPLPDEAAR